MRVVPSIGDAIKCTKPDHRSIAKGVEGGLSTIFESRYVCVGVRRSRLEWNVSCGKCCGNGTDRSARVQEIERCRRAGAVPAGMSRGISEAKKMRRGAGVAEEGELV